MPRHPIEEHHAPGRARPEGAEATGGSCSEFYTKLRGSLCQYHDGGLRTGVFIDYNDLGIGLVRPIGAYKAPPPRLKQIALKDLIFPNRRATSKVP